MAKKSISIEDSLRAAIDEVEGAETEPETVEAAPEPEEEVVAEEETEAAPEPEPEAEIAPEPEEEDEWEPAKCLTEDERAEFKALSKEAKPMVDRFVRRRDLSMQRWVNKVRAEAGQYVQEQVGTISEITSAIEPHVSRLNLERKDIASTIRSLLEWDQVIESNSTDAIAQLCRLKNVTPRQLFDYMNGDGASEDASQSSGSPDPRIDTVLSKLEAIEAENAQLRSGAVRSQWTGVVGQIAASRTETGEPMYPYYEDVRQEMAQWTRLIGSQNPNLTPQQLFHTAYEKACWSNEGVRDLLLRERQAQKASVGLKKKQAASSLPASSSNGIGSKSPKTPLSGNLSIEESLNAAIDELGYEF